MKDRKKHKAALTDRKSLAAQNRMKQIATMASDQQAPRKKRKGNAEDTFGASDADWHVYREIVRGFATFVASLSSCLSTFMGAGR